LRRLVVVLNSRGGDRNLELTFTDDKFRWDANLMFRVIFINRHDGSSWYRIPFENVLYFYEEEVKEVNKGG